MTTLQFTRDIVEGLGGKLEVFRFDCGLTIAVTLAPGITWRGSAECGEEAALFNRLHGWLDQQPWPTEDDPRVKHEGATL